MAAIPGELIGLVTFPGVIIHELGHEIFCKLSKLQVFEVKYFQYQQPQGYVIHSRPETFKQLFLSVTGPFFVNTILSLLMFIVILGMTDTNYLDYGPIMLLQFPQIIFAWIAFSIAVHAFPSSHDAKNLWEGTLKYIGENNFLAIIGLPVAGIIFIANLLSIVWFDFIYGFLVILLAYFISSSIKMPIIFSLTSIACLITIYFILKPLLNKNVALKLITVVIMLFVAYNVIATGISNHNNIVETEKDEQAKQTQEKQESTSKNTALQESITACANLELEIERTFCFAEEAVKQQNKGIDAVKEICSKTNNSDLCNYYSAYILEDSKYCENIEDKIGCKIVSDSEFCKTFQSRLRCMNERAILISFVDENKSAQIIKEINYTYNNFEKICSRPADENDMLLCIGGKPDPEKIGLETKEELINEETIKEELEERSFNNKFLTLYLLSKAAEFETNKVGGN